MIKRLTPEETRSAIRDFGIEQSAGPTFGICDSTNGVRYAFHKHTRHQFLFPVAGLLCVETERALFSCSAQAGLWIPAGTLHATTSGACPIISLFFHKKNFTAVRDVPAMIRITPLLREAASHAVDQKNAAGGYAQELFRVVYGLIRENCAEASWPSLPMSRSEPMQRAIGIVWEKLSSLDVRELARLSGQSERTLRRRFMAELGIGPELFIQRARLIRAMQLLLRESVSTITDIALEAGYGNHSAFSSAFRAFTGQTPTHFRAMGGQKISAGAGHTAKA